MGRHQWCNSLIEAWDFNYFLSRTEITISYCLLIVHNSQHKHQHQHRDKCIYRLQRIWAKVMLVQVSVFLSRRGSASVHGGIQTPPTPPEHTNTQEQTPPRANTTLRSDTPLGPGTHPRTRYTHPPIMKYMPQDQVNPPGTRYNPHDQMIHPPPEDIPPKSIHPPGTRYNTQDQLHPPKSIHPRHTVKEQPVCIQLECIPVGVHAVTIIYIHILICSFIKVCSNLTSFMPFY